MRRVASPCACPSVCRLRITQRSSAQVAVSGSRSETQSPDCAVLAELPGRTEQRREFFVLLSSAERIRQFEGTGLAAFPIQPRLVIEGVRLAGPPCMNRKMTRLARGRMVRRLGRKRSRRGRGRAGGFRRRGPRTRDNRTPPPPVSAGSGDPTGIDGPVARRSWFTFMACLIRKTQSRYRNCELHRSAWQSAAKASAPTGRRPSEPRRPRAASSARYSRANRSSPAEGERPKTSR